MEKIITEFLVFNLFWLDEKAELGPGYRLIESVPYAMRWQHYALCTASCYAPAARSWYLASWPSGGRAHQPTMSFLPSPCTWLSGLACALTSALYLLPSICCHCFTCAAAPRFGISQSDGAFFGGLTSITGGSMV